MKNKKNLICLSFVFVFAFLLGCTSSGKFAKPVIREHEDRMHWEISASNGTTVHILGTIHIGEEEPLPINEELLNTFLQADLIYGELSTFDLAKLSNAMVSFLEKNLIMDDKGNPVSITEFITEKEADMLKLILVMGGATEEQVESALFMPPWYWNNSLEQGLIQACGYYPNTGIDLYLYDIAAKNNLVVLGLDSLEEQLNLLNYGSVEDQVLLLKDNLESILNLETYQTELDSLYNSFKNNEKEILTSSLYPDLFSIEGLSQNYIMGYYENLIAKRNSSWAEQITEMLEQEGKTFFIFAGAAHWLCEPSVFDFLVNQNVAVWE